MIAEEPISAVAAKSLFLNYASRFDEDDYHQSWNGVLNEANIFYVAKLLRSIFENKIFAIGDFQYVDTPNPKFELRTDCFFNSSWTDGCKDMVRVRLAADYPHITFSCGSSLWSWDAAPGNTYDDSGRYAIINFNGESVEVRQRAPCGVLHAHIFSVQHDSDIEQVR
jgi:hypothetical protein